MLDKQIKIYSVDTGNFYSNREAHLHWLNHKLRVERNRLINGETIRDSNGKIKRTIIGLKNIECEFDKYGIRGNDLKLIYELEYDFSQWVEDAQKLSDLGEQYCRIKDLITIKNNKIKNSKNKLLKILSNKVNTNIQSNGRHHIRELRENQVSSKNIISVFDSSFTRMIDARPDELCEDFMVVQVYYFDIIKDLIFHGFTYKGEKYIYFTSSAGQIRTKKTVFVKESVWNKYEKTIMCGLTIDSINEKGGNNPNKHLAYMALANSATDVWKEFDIDKTIVIDDFETNVYGDFDLIDETDYSITRKTDYIPITHTDGAGMMLPCMGKNRMVRLPWIKGLLGSFDFIKFIQVNNCSPVIKDIYGKEHNVIDEDIQIIFTKSQFKLWKYYDSWEQYKELYKKYNCVAGYVNIEEDRIKNATINYQMLQSLTDITDDEILNIINPSVSKLKNICSSVDSVKNVFGVTPYNQNKTAFQKSIELYPELLNDVYIKNKLKDIKDSMVKNYKSGKLQIYGKYTFILPDLYAACEYWFLNIKEPKGLLDDGETFCWLFRKNDKLDCLRSPHLYREHAIRKNIACKNHGDRQQKTREWFCTDAIYTSCHDLISKILQFDVDGDKSLVVADENIISVAEKNMVDIVPLYYNMKKASPSTLNSQTIYDGLNAAFTGSNIGLYSNHISKIWNHEVFINGSSEEKQEALNIIKLLCCENNFKIDYAKTLYMPQRPEIIKERIAFYTKENVPHFFKYAKDKEDHQVASVTQSFVNKLDELIPNPRISCKYIKSNGKNGRLEKPDYTLMMSNPDIEVKIVKTESGRLIEGTNPVILKYIEKSKEFGQKISSVAVSKNIPRDAICKTQIRADLLYGNIAHDVKQELSQFGYSEIEIADILVKYLYGIKESKYKDLLWTCYGEHLYENLRRNKKLKIKVVQCIDCGEWFEVSNKDNKTCRCLSCYSEYRRNYYKENKRKNREKLIMSTEQQSC